MRLLLILVLAAWIGVSIGCNKKESYKTRDVDPAAADPGALITDDPALSGKAPADAAKPDAARPDAAKPDTAKPDEEKAEAQPTEGSEAKPEAPAEKE